MESVVWFEVYLFIYLVVMVVWFVRGIFFCFFMGGFVDIMWCMFVGDQGKVDFLFVYVDCFYMDFYVVVQVIGLVVGFINKMLFYLVEMIIVVIQVGNMYQIVDKQIVQVDEEVKVGYVGDYVGEDVVYLILYEVVFQLVRYFVCCFVGVVFGY